MTTSIVQLSSDLHVREPGRLAYGRLDTAPFVEDAVRKSFGSASSQASRSSKQKYYWALRDWELHAPHGHGNPLEARSRAGRKALARFHSDSTVTLASSAPRWYRKVSDHRIRTGNDRMLRRWLADPQFDPVFRAHHRHDANWRWW